MLPWPSSNFWEQLFEKVNVNCMLRKEPESRFKKKVLTPHLIQCENLPFLPIHVPSAEAKVFQVELYY